MFKNKKNQNIPQLPFANITNPFLRTQKKTAVEINLRLPSMLHGKKGFERIVWAFKNVLVNSVTWLFCDLSSEPNYENEGLYSPLKPRHL